MKNEEYFERYLDALRFMFLCWIGGRFAGLPKNIGQDVGGIRWWMVEFYS